jgi:hypothetical protein
MVLAICFGWNHLPDQPSEGFPHIPGFNLVMGVVSWTSHPADPGHSPVGEPGIQGIRQYRNGCASPDPTEDNWLKLSSDARKISLDPRLYTAGAGDDRSAQDKGTVIVFSDFFQRKGEDGSSEFNLFHEIRDKLVKAGVPRDQIAVIHEFEKKEAKEQLFARVRNGRVRVLMGSTDKMGVGTNVQKRLTALLHLRPAVETGPGGTARGPHHPRR